MRRNQNPYRGFRFPPEIIAHTVWLYHCFSLSLRDVELILAARGVAVSYESRFRQPTRYVRPSGYDCLDRAIRIEGGRASLRRMCWKGGV